MSQAKLAGKLFVTPQAISRWENGETEPDLDTIDKIASIFNVTVDYIIHGGSPVNQNSRYDHVYYLYCLIGSPIMIVMSIVFAVVTITLGRVVLWDIVYAAVSLLFLVSILVFEIRHRRKNGSKK